MSRRRIIAGNWKMNKTPSEAVELANTLIPIVKNDDVDVVFCVPAIDIIPVVEAVKGTNVEVGAENLYFEESGAYTGEIAANMLTDAGVKYVIIGHSERAGDHDRLDPSADQDRVSGYHGGPGKEGCHRLRANLGDRNRQNGNR